MVQDEIVGKLSAFEDYLAKVQSPILKRLNPGVDFNRGDFEDFKSNNLVMPEAFFALYQWRNGTNLDGLSILAQTWLFRLASFMNFDKAFDLYSMMAGQDEFWPVTRFPLFESGGGEVYTLECDERRNDYGMIYFYSPGELDFEVTASMFDSLYTLIDTIFSCYKEGVYSNDRATGKLVTIDMKRLFAISRQKNPKSDYWRFKKI